MGDTIRFTSYVGIVYNGRIRFITDDSGATNVGEKAMAFSASDARNIVCDLVRRGNTGAVVVTAPQHDVGQKLYNPDSSDIVFTQREIDAFEQKGFKRWTRGKIDRLYMNPSKMSLRRTKNGFEFEGEPITADVAFELDWAKTYIDCGTGMVYSNSRIAGEWADRILKSVMNLDTTENPVA